VQQLIVPGEYFRGKFGWHLHGLRSNAETYKAIDADV
jgi:hypothetical protein